MTFPWHAPKYLAFSRGGDVSGRPSIDDTASAYLNRLYGPEDHVEAYADLYGRDPSGYNLRAATRGIPAPYYGRQPDEEIMARVMRPFAGYFDGGRVSYPGFDDPSRVRYFEEGGDGYGGGGGGDPGEGGGGPAGGGGGGGGPSGGGEGSGGYGNGGDGWSGGSNGEGYAGTGGPSSDNDGGWSGGNNGQGYGGSNSNSNSGDSYSGYSGGDGWSGGNNGEGYSGAGGGNQAGAAGGSSDPSSDGSQGPGSAVGGNGDGYSGYSGGDGWSGGNDGQGYSGYSGDSGPASAVGFGGGADALAGNSGASLAGLSDAAPDFGSYAGPADPSFFSGAADTSFGNPGFGNFGAGLANDVGMNSPIGGVANGRAGGADTLNGPLGIGGSSFGSFSAGDPTLAGTAASFGLGSNGPDFSNVGLNGLSAADVSPANPGFGNAAPDFGSYAGPADPSFFSGAADTSFGNPGFGNFGAQLADVAGLNSPIGGVATGRSGGAEYFGGAPGLGIGGNSFGSFSAGDPNFGGNPAALGLGDNGPTFADAAFNGLGGASITTSQGTEPPDFGTNNEKSMVDIPDIGVGFDLPGYLSDSFDSLMDSAARSRAAANAARDAAAIANTPQFNNNDPFGKPAGVAPPATPNEFTVSSYTPSFVAANLAGLPAANPVSVSYTDMDRQDITVPGLSARDQVGTFGLTGMGSTLSAPGLSQSGRFGGATTADENTTYTDGRTPGSFTVSGTTPPAASPSSPPAASPSSPPAASPSSTISTITAGPEAEAEPDLVAGTYAPTGTWADPLTGNRYSSTGDRLLGNGALQTGVGALTNVLSGMNPLSAAANAITGLTTGRNFGDRMAGADPFTDPNAGLGDGGTNGGGISGVNAPASSIPSGPPPAAVGGTGVTSGINPIAYGNRNYTGFPGDPLTYGMRAGRKSFYDRVNFASGGRVGALNMIKAMTSR